MEKNNLHLLSVPDGMRIRIALPYTEEQFKKRRIDYIPEDYLICQTGERINFDLKRIRDHERFIENCNAINQRAREKARAYARRKQLEALGVKFDE